MRLTPSLSTPDSWFNDTFAVQTDEPAIHSVLASSAELRIRIAEAFAAFDSKPKCVIKAVHCRDRLLWLQASPATLSEVSPGTGHTSTDREAVRAEFQQRLENIETSLKPLIQPTWVDRPDRGLGWMKAVSIVCGAVALLGFAHWMTLADLCSLSAYSTCLHALRASLSTVVICLALVYALRSYRAPLLMIQILSLVAPSAYFWAFGHYKELNGDDYLQAVHYLAPIDRVRIESGKDGQHFVATISQWPTGSYTFEAHVPEVVYDNPQAYRLDAMFHQGALGDPWIDRSWRIVPLLDP